MTPCASQNEADRDDVHPPALFIAASPTIGSRVSRLLLPAEQRLDQIASWACEPFGETHGGQKRAGRIGFDPWRRLFRRGWKAESADAKLCFQPLLVNTLGIQQPCWLSELIPLIEAGGDDGHRCTGR